jgi:hypothetical protein
MLQTPSVPYKKLVDQLRTTDPDQQNYAFQALLKATDIPVDWAYEVWDDLLGTLVDGDNRQRAIAAQVLSNLAKSDSQQRMRKDLAALLKVTKDERFVTARHCLQSLWKVGVAGKPQRKVLLKGLAARFKECGPEKNCTLIRFDILVALRRVFDLVNDEQIPMTAERLIAMEEDLKYQKKYATVWRKNKPSVFGKHSPARSQATGIKPKTIA